MWYETAKPFVDRGELQIIGVVQEQHAERTRLYKQWKQFDFPIAQDATTELNLNVVPIPILIDEHGIVRDNRARPETLPDFIKQDFPPATQSAGKSTEDAAVAANVRASEPTSDANQSATEKLIADGNRLLNFSNPKKYDQAIAAFGKAVKSDPGSGKAHFSLGVAHRMRHDSVQRKPDDFELASQNWSAALAIDPNQYIWRRRIEQYGPRQIKPYPFYDWVRQANRDIAARGEQPIQLDVRLTDAETAQPARKFSAETAAAENPDPELKILLVEDSAMRVSSSVVPANVKPGEVVRVHLDLTLEGSEFNGEAGPILVWIDEKSKGQPEKRLLEFTANEGEKSVSHRSLEFEFQTSTDGGKETAIDGFLLCHVCDDAGVCVYRRRNFSIDFQKK